MSWSQQQQLKLQQLQLQQQQLLLQRQQQLQWQMQQQQQQRQSGAGGWSTTPAGTAQAAPVGGGMGTQVSGRVPGNGASVVMPNGYAPGGGMGTGRLR